jgi:hypothetical protein
LLFLGLRLLEVVADLGILFLGVNKNDRRKLTFTYTLHDSQIIVPRLNRPRSDACTSIQLQTHRFKSQICKSDTVSQTNFIPDRQIGNRRVDGAVTNKKLRDRAVRMLQDLTDLNRDEADFLLEKSGKSVKLALMMHWTGLEKQECDRILGEFQGNLRSAVASISH